MVIEVLTAGFRPAALPGSNELASNRGYQFMNQSEGTGRERTDIFQH